MPENTADQRIEQAVNFIAEYGSIDGAHHKQWCLDQILRKLLTPEGYEAWIAKVNSDEYPPWDVGIAP